MEASRIKFTAVVLLVRWNLVSMRYILELIVDISIVFQQR